MSNELAPARFPAIVITAPGRQDVRVICGTWCSAAGQASSVSSGVLTLRVPDPGRKLVGLRLVPDVRIAGPLLDFRRGGDLAHHMPRFC